MKYNSETRRRDKNFYSWMRKVDPDTEIQQVFFGVHLINMFPNYVIGILESEKTAMLCDLFYDEKIVWVT